MKKNRMTVAIILIVSAVSVGLALRPAGIGTIYCFADIVASCVDQNKACKDYGQPASTRIDYQWMLIPIYPTHNPCADGFSPFDGASYTTCLRRYPGIDRFVQTLP